MINESTKNPTIDWHLTIQSSKSRALLEPNRNTEVIDRVFTELGFNKLFLDQSEPIRRPHFCTNEPEQQPLILHIDDDEDLLDALSARLEKNGFRVACALDGVPGMQSALAYPADCIVLDYDMPGARGDEVIKVLKGNNRTKDIPIIVLTAMNKKSLRRHMLSMGADVFMPKPFEFGELHKEILNLIAPGNNAPSTTAFGDEE